MIWKMFQQTRTNRQVWYQLIVKSQMCKSGLYAGPWRWSGKLTSNALLFMVGPGGAGAAAGGRASGHHPGQQVAPVEDPYASSPHIQPL